MFTSACNSIVCLNQPLFELKAESTAECGAYFTLAHSFMVLRIFNVSIHGFLKLQTEIYISLSPDV